MREYFGGTLFCYYKQQKHSLGQISIVGDTKYCRIKIDLFPSISHPSCVSQNGGRKLDDLIVNYVKDTYNPVKRDPLEEQVLGNEGHVIFALVLVKDYEEFYKKMLDVIAKDLQIENITIRER